MLNVDVVSLQNDDSWHILSELADSGPGSGPGSEESQETKLYLYANCGNK